MLRRYNKLTIEVKKIISYNLNGIRAALGKDLIGWLKVENPDMLCIQETKASSDQFDTRIFEELGYEHYWFSAEKKGYSGVGILTKLKPDKIIYGMDNPTYDSEGRVLQADFGDVSLISVYFPSGTSGDARQDFKMDFLEDFHKYLKNLRKTRPNLIVSGDYNICHKPIDINYPKKHEQMSGYLPEERAWVDQFVADGFVDTFREFNKESNQYSWWSYRSGARPKNLGWRIDYHMVTDSLKSKLVNAKILQQVVHSDHCPVVVEIDF